MGGTLMPKMWGEIGAREKLSAPWAIPGSTATSTWPTDFRWGRFNFDTDVERTKETLIGRPNERPKRVR